MEKKARESFFLMLFIVSFIYFFRCKKAHESLMLNLLATYSFIHEILSFSPMILEKEDALSSICLIVK